MKVWYLPLEPYRERYTEQLERWTTTALARRGIPFAVVRPTGPNATRVAPISTGPVLDAHRRSIYGLAQTAELISALEAGLVGSDDVIWLADLFQPGYETIPYCLDQQRLRTRIVAQCWAQSVDPNDFTFPMRQWMRPYERMVDRSIERIFVASTVLKEMLEAAMFEAPIDVVGLPFSSEDVVARTLAETPNVPIRALDARERRILFSSRLDREKQPHLFLDLAVGARRHPYLEQYRFAIASGSSTLRSNDPSVIERVAGLVEGGRIDLHLGLEKGRYYRLLAESRVHVNCALQDFVSFTLLEASTLGTPTLAPAHLSFPEALFNDERFLYVPWSPSDLEARLVSLLESIEQPGVIGMLDRASIRRPALMHDRSLDRMIDAIVELPSRRGRRHVQ